MPVRKLQEMEELRFKLWLQLYHWRKTLLVFITSTLILAGFFFMLNVTQFEELPVTRREIVQTSIKSNKLQSKIMKQEYHKVPKVKISNTPALRFLINEPYFCLEQKYLYIIVICSSPENIEKRMAIRNTWGNHVVLNNTRGATIFLLGKMHNNMRLQKQVYEESMNYRDIVQGDFIDTYKNLTLKSIMALKWFSSYCSQVNVLMKTDDDIFINTEKLAKYIEERQFKKRWIVGCVKTHAAYPIKIKKNKAVPVLSLPYGHPTFVAGAGYIMSNDIVELLYQKSLQLTLVPVEDVFITGHCAKALGVIPEHDSRFSCGENVKNFCDLSDSMLTGHRIIAEQQEKIWNLVHDPKSCRKSKFVSTKNYKH